MGKGISTIIASLLTLIITISLAGLAYGYISGVFTERTATVFSVVDSYNNTITIRNDGTTSITSLTATVDGQLANIAVVPNTQGLVGYWSFNEGTGTTTSDSSGNANDGRLSCVGGGCSNPTWTNGVFGKALNFDGVDDYVQINNYINSLAQPAEITYAAWVKLNSISDWQHIAGWDWGDSTGLFVYPDGRLTFTLYDPGANWRIVSSTSAIIWGQGAFIAATFNDATDKVKFYINGVSGLGDEASFPYSPRISPGVYRIEIGKTTIGYPNQYSRASGVIDEVQIYNRALSDNEIKALASGVIATGQSATIKFLTPLTAGTRTVRLCSPGMCQAVYLTIG